jgi:rubrerythrin
MSYSIEEAITTAMEMESRVRDVYLDAEKLADRVVGKHVLSVLAKEEQDHLDYLKHKLEEWQKDGTITGEELESVIPPKRIIDREVEKLGGKVKSHERDLHHSTELRMLQNAQEVEQETSDFYKRMVEELPEEVRPLFQRFVEIEEGHLAIVQAEIDYISGPGFWFDFREFDLSGG